jgi:hypothetical protein
MRWGLAAGTALSATWKFTGEAYAANCSYYGIYNRWGCNCAPTGRCSSSICSSGNCTSGHRRCDYWTQPNSQGQYCWCSNRCYSGSTLGHYTCCDCYTTSGSGCNRSATHCICVQWHAG